MKKRKKSRRPAVRMTKSYRNEVSNRVEYSQAHSKRVASEGRSSPGQIEVSYEKAWEEHPNGFKKGRDCLNVRCNFPSLENVDLRVIVRRFKRRWMICLGFGPMAFFPPNPSGLDQSNNKPSIEVSVKLSIPITGQIHVGMPSKVPFDPLPPLPQDSSTPPHG